MELCSNCNGSCCRAPNVEVTGYDILQIYKTLAIDPFLFLIVLPVEGQKLKDSRGKTPLFKFTDLDPEKYYKIILRSVPTAIFPENSSKCIFLLEWDPEKFGLEAPDGIIGRCGIYTIRPYTCRTFPTRLNDDLEPLMQDPYTMVRKSTDEHWQKPPYRLCPGPVDEKDYINFSEQYYKDLYAMHTETLFFLKIAEKWNQNPDVSDNFIGFIEKEYKNRLLPPEK